LPRGWGRDNESNVLPPMVAPLGEEGAPGPVGELHAAAASTNPTTIHMRLLMGSSFVAAHHRGSVFSRLLQGLAVAECLYEATHRSSGARQSLRRSSQVVVAVWFI
jgi:hypothetical protein